MKAWRVIGSFGLVTAGAVALVLSFAVPAHAQDEWLIAMGDANSFRGINVPNPDPNGNNWNSVDAGAFFPSLIDIHSNSTALALGFSAAGGNDYFNGPSGAVQNPNSVVINSAALGDLGYKDGVYHYYVNSEIQIQGLDPTKQYTLTLFGSHAFSTDNSTTYTAYTDGGFSNAVASTSLNVQDPTNVGQWNTNQVAVLANLTPQAGNIIYLGFIGSQGDLGYLNAIEIQQVPEPATVTLVGLGILGAAALRRRRAS